LQLDVCARNCMDSLQKLQFKEADKGLG